VRFLSLSSFRAGADEYTFLQTLHHIDTEEELIPLFDKDTDGSKPKSNCVMGRRNYCMADYNAADELVFTVCVEKSQGSGTTAGYSLAAPPPRW